MDIYIVATRAGTECVVTTVRRRSGINLRAFRIDVRVLLPFHPTHSAAWQKIG